MADKEFYRSEFQKMLPFVKMSACCREVGITQSNFNWFIHGRDERLSVDKCKKLYDFIKCNIL